MKPFVSIVVPVYNAQRFLNRCISSLMAQAYPQDRLEILMVDNNSADASCAIALRFGDRIKLLHQEVQGSYAARNLGAAKARGDILAFIDPDCEAAPEWVNELTSAFEREQSFVVLGSRTYESGSNLLLKLCAFEDNVVSYIFKHHVEAALFGYTNNMAIRREIFEGMGGFMEVDRGADSVLLREVVKQKGMQCASYAPRASVVHLEIASIEAYLKKKRVYGRVSRNSILGNAPRSLPLLTRLELARRANAMVPGTRVQSIQFLGLLLWSACLYHVPFRLRMRTVS